MSDSQKKTPIFNEHLKLKGKMVDFAGWALPVQYTGIIAEHLQTRNAASLFDTSHMGEIMIKGEDAESFLQFLMTNDISPLKEGFACYSLICNEKGQSLDDCFIYKMDSEQYFLVVNASNIEKIFRWMEFRQNSFEVEINNLSDSLGKIDLQGPLAEKILQEAIDEDCSEENWPRFSFRQSTVGSYGAMISRTGYTGEDGFELYCSWDETEAVWQRLLSLGKKQGLGPAGLGARDTLRLESCYSLYGHELNEETTPVESGLGWVVKDKKDDFLGKEILLKQKKEGVPKKMIAFEMTEKAIPRQGCLLFSGDREVGNVTSGGVSPTLEKQIGLGFIENDLAKPGMEIFVDIRGKKKRALVVKRPFYPFKGGR